MLRCFLVALAITWALPAGSHDGVDARNRISFRVEANREVENDWVTARFSVLAEGKESSAVANIVNAKMKTGLSRAKKVKGVEVHSGAYTTQPVYDDGRVVRWRAHQEMRVESGDVDRLAKLIGDLQAESIPLSRIDFSVKPETRKALEEELISEALRAFRTRAALIAGAMKAADWSLVSLSVGGSGGSPRMLHGQRESRMMAASSAAPPVFEAGTSDIRMQVEGQVELE